MTAALLEILQNNSVFGVAFLIWAWVVWSMGQRILRQLSDLTKKVSAMNYKLSNRLTKVEAHLESDSDFKPYRNGET